MPDMMKVNRAYKFRIYPDSEQEVNLAKTFGCCRFVWNQMLMDECDFYLATDAHFVPTPAKYKKRFPFLKEVDSLALANTQMDLNQAFKRFFEDPNVGHPQFKSKKKSHKSYTTNCQYPSGGNPTIQVVFGEGIVLPKVGMVKTLFHRRPNPDWTLKRATVSQTPSGEYYCSLQYEFEVPVPERVLPTKERTLGLDYSSPKFYVDHTGFSPERPQWFRESEKKLARYQRRLTRMVPGSKNWQAMKLKIQKLQAHIANQRKDFIHKESRRIANAWDAVCVEDLNLRDMARSLNLGKSTLDNGFGGFRVVLAYKLEELGKPLIKIDKWFPSSKTCHNCGYIKKDLTLKDRIWVCPVCGAVVERDTNAGQNIRDEGLRVFYEGLGELTSVPASALL